MASRKLRKQLKKLLLAAPLIAQAGCGSPIGGGGCINPGGCGPCPEVPTTFAIADAGAFLDGGSFDCELACTTLNHGFKPDSCAAATVDGGPGVTCNNQSPCHTGRRPAGLLATTGSSASTPLGAWLAECARLEAAAVHAFARTARELEAHGAPRRLVARARGAAADEVRHARAMRSQARRHGAAPLRAKVDRSAHARRPLFELALENAVEGCVRETYGALVAQWQAKAALDAPLRRALKAIAHDETNHAELSWDLKAWLDTRLTAREREQLRAAMLEAVAQLERELSADPAEECRSAAGVPAAGVSRAFVSALRQDLWRC